MRFSLSDEITFFFENEQLAINDHQKIQEVQKIQTKVVMISVCTHPFNTITNNITTIFFFF